MPRLSHVDLCLFVQVLNIPQERIPDRLLEVLKSGNRPSINSFLRTELSELSPRNSFVSEQTNLHESIHIIQSVIYPYIRWYAVVSFYIINNLFERAVDFIEDFSNLEMELRCPELHLMEVEYFVWTGSNHKIAISLESADPGNQYSFFSKINVIDMLENAASLLQYKISTSNDFPCWVDYMRWSKRNPAYTGLLKALGQYIEDNDLALRKFASLIQLSFETNQPVRAFAMLMGHSKLLVMEEILTKSFDKESPVDGSRYLTRT